MRILRITLTACLLSFFGFTAQAQMQFGGGIATNANFNQFGVQARGQYQINDTWRAAADFTYLFPEFGSAWEFNPNAHYIFKDDGEGQKFYGLAGLSIYHFSFNSEFNNILGIDASFTDVGLNVGAGANIPLGSMTGYAEAKFGIGGSEFGLAVGVLFGN